MAEENKAPKKETPRSETPRRKGPLSEPYIPTKITPPPKKGEKPQEETKSS